MFYIYYANLLETQKDILLHILEKDPNPDPFQAETILVQSLGMEQWLNWQIAEKIGVATNLAYPLPASFIWQLYVDNLPNVEEQSFFKAEHLIWRVMRLLPHFLSQDAFAPLKYYLANHQENEQKKRYHLAEEIAKLFDQYLVYRPHWIHYWEEKKEAHILQEILQAKEGKNMSYLAQIQQDIQWQGILWRALIADIQAQTGQPYVQHRASLHRQFLQKLSHTAPKNLPPRIFLFGISALPKAYLQTLQALSPYCDIHLFFTNGCREYWGDMLDPKIWQRRQLHQCLQDMTQKDTPFITGHPLLASWGKMGRDFLTLLTELASETSTPTQEIDAYIESNEITLLHQIQRQILNASPSQRGSLVWKKEDQSLSIHACYSQMREVEVLRDYLLHLFNQHPDLTPKDVIVMAGDIDQYAPYIQAVFSQNTPFLPFAISDSKLTEDDVLVASFLQLLQLKQSQFTAEEVLAWLDVPMIRQRFTIESDELAHLHHWVEQAGIRFGLAKESQQALKNYNAWQAGLERMLLGFSLREENGIWQDNLALDSTAGLQGQLVGKLIAFLHALWDWYNQLHTPHTIQQWQHLLTALITQFFDESQQSPIWLYLQATIEQLTEHMSKGDFNETIDSEIIAESLNKRLQNEPYRCRFTLGKINFCTLLPMRSIPFKVICLLGMNEGDYPRLQIPNSFDLMQYQPQKGDRFRRDDDRYLFLEALLSAQSYFYISYIGHTITDDSPKEPSVLVSQLIDYLAENSETDMLNLEIVQHHSLNAFSLKNFTQPPFSFAKQWLPFVHQKQAVPHKPFITPLESDLQIPRSVSLEDLIYFIQDPVKYFFEKRLGVYFRQTNEQISENENFTLDALQNYKIHQQLLEHAQEHFDDEWQKWQIKGMLPRGSFAEVVKKNTQKELQDFRHLLAQILPDNASPNGEFMSIQLAFPTQQVVLKGGIKGIFSEKKQRISFRFATLKGKDIIQNWIYYLALKASEAGKNEIFHPPLHLAKDKCFTFKGVSSEQAYTQLAQYIDAFLQSRTQLFLLPNDELHHYLTDVMQESLSANLMKRIEKKKDNDPYWQRIAYQQDMLAELPKMIETTNQWWHLLAFCYENKNKT